MLDTTKVKVRITKVLLNRIMTGRKKAIPEHFRYIEETVETEFGCFMLTLFFEKKYMLLELSPSQHLVGHNIFGRNRAKVLILGSIGLVYEHYNLPFTDAQKDYYKKQDFKMLRGDATGACLLESQSAVSETMALLCDHITAHGYHINTHRGPDGTETIYVGKSSKRSTLKFYIKLSRFIEVSNEATKDLPYYPELLAYVENVLRVENSVRSRELPRHGLELASGWTPEKVRDVLVERLTKYGLSRQLVAELPADVVAGLNKIKLKKYNDWRNGTDLRKTLNDATFRRDYEYFMQFGLDIYRTRADTPDAVLLTSRVSAEKLKTTYPKRFADMGAVFNRMK